MKREAEGNVGSVIIEYARKLTDYDLLEVGEKLAEADRELDNVIAEKKLIVSKQSAKIKTVEADVKRYIRLLRDKEEIVEAECDVEYSYEEGIVRYYEVDSGEFVHERKITQEERQLKLFADGQLSKEDDVEEMDEVEESEE